MELSAHFRVVASRRVPAVVSGWCRRANLHRLGSCRGGGQGPANQRREFRLNESAKRSDRTDGRQRLLDAAEVLLDEHGIDGTSAAAVIAASGHRNAGAVNYYFGDLDHLIEAVLIHRAEHLDMERHRLLDELEAAGPVDPRDALLAGLTPLIGLLDHPAGRRYLRLLNQAANHPRFFARTNIDFNASVGRAAMHLMPLVADLAPDRRAHRVQIVLGSILYAFSEQARLIDSPTPSRRALSTDEFADDVVSTVTAALAAKPGANQTS
jgi:AcrR family transcriptional regulator